MSISVGQVLSTPSATTTPGAATPAAPAKLFGSTSDSAYSVAIQPLVGGGVLFQAFGLVEGDTIELQMSTGPGDGELFQPIVVKGTPVVLTHTNAIVFVPFPARLRAAYSGDHLGQFDLYAQGIPYAAYPAMFAYV